MARTAHLIGGVSTLELVACQSGRTPQPRVDGIRKTTQSLLYVE